MSSRGVFRWSFIEKRFNGFYLLTIFTKKVHHRRLAWSLNTPVGSRLDTIARKSPYLVQVGENAVQEMLRVFSPSYRRKSL